MRQGQLVLLVRRERQVRLGRWCDRCCTGSTGPAGATGATGGAPGINAYSTTPQFSQPAVGSNIAVQIPSGYWLQVGQYVFIASGGYYQVASGSTPTFYLDNLGYSGNIPVGSAVAASEISPAGIHRSDWCDRCYRSDWCDRSDRSDRCNGATGATGPQGATGATGLLVRQVRQEALGSMLTARRRSSRSPQLAPTSLFRYQAAIGSRWGNMSSSPPGATIKSQAAALQLSISITSATAATFLSVQLSQRPRCLQQAFKERLVRPVLLVRQERQVLLARLVRQGRRSDRSNWPCWCDRCDRRRWDQCLQHDAAVQPASSWL